MELTYVCPACSDVGSIVSVERAAGFRCGKCSTDRTFPEGAIERGSLRFCPVCSTEDLYLQKDFPQGLGVTIVVVGFVVSSIYWYLERPLVTYAILLASALLDMLLYYKVPNVTICYRCLSQFRGEGVNPGEAFKHFDLAIGERYRQERLRVEEHRKVEGR